MLPTSSTTVSHSLQHPFLGWRNWLREMGDPTTCDIPQVMFKPFSDVKAFLQPPAPSCRKHLFTVHSKHMYSLCLNASSNTGLLVFLFTSIIFIIKYFEHPEKHCWFPYHNSYPRAHHWEWIKVNIFLYLLQIFFFFKKINYYCNDIYDILPSSLSPQRNHYPQITTHSTHFLNFYHTSIYLWTTHLVLTVLKLYLSCITL